MLPPLVREKSKATSLSTIFTVAELGVTIVYAALGESVRITVSVGSTNASSTGVRMIDAEAAPAGIVMDPPSEGAAV